LACQNTRVPHSRSSRPGPKDNLYYSFGDPNVAYHVETLVGLRRLSQFLTTLVGLASVDQLSGLMHFVDRHIDGHHGQNDGDLDAGDFQFLHRPFAVALLEAGVRVAGAVFRDGNGGSVAKSLTDDAKG
jgi:hypothetical protein